MIRFSLILLLLNIFGLSVLAAELTLIDPMRPENLSKPKPKIVIKKPVKKVVKVVRKDPKPLILQQTVVSKERRFAIINGFTLTEGERVKGGYTVFQINDDNVVLLRNDKELILYLAGRTNIKELSR